MLTNIADVSAQCGGKRVENGNGGAHNQYRHGQSGGQYPVAGGPPFDTAPNTADGRDQE